MAQNALRKNPTIFQKAARQRWPQEYREQGVQGDGQFAVLGCSFLHPSARTMCYGELNLFETVDEAQAFADAVNRRVSYPGRIAYCHAQSKGVCNGTHSVVSLSV